MFSSAIYSGRYSTALCVAAALWVAGSPAAAAEAASSTCRRIETTLAASQASPRELRRYDKAIRAQQIELTKVSAQLAHARCNGVFAGLRPQCGALNAAVGRMESNLASLQHARAAVIDANASRRRLLAAYEGKGCEDAPSQMTTSALPALQPEKPALFQNLYSGQPQAAPQEGAARVEESAPETPLSVTPASVHTSTGETGMGSASVFHVPGAALPTVETVSVSGRNETTASVAIDPDPTRIVRIVGPKFLPDPDETIDLKRPGSRR